MQNQFSIEFNLVKKQLLPVYYYLGDFRKLTQLLTENETTAESIQDRRIKARFYAWLGISYWNYGNAQKGYEYLHRGLEIGDEVVDNIAIGYSCALLTWACTGLSLYEEAEATLQELISFDEKTGAHAATLPGYAFYGATKIAKGEMSKGLEIILSAQRRAIKFQRNNIHVISEFVLGFVYFQILEGKGPKNLLTLAKNFGFLMKNLPSAFQKGESHFLNVIETGDITSQTEKTAGEHYDHYSSVKGMVSK